MSDRSRFIIKCLRRNQTWPDVYPQCHHYWLSLSSLNKTLFFGILTHSIFWGLIWWFSVTFGVGLTKPWARPILSTQIIKVRISFPTEEFFWDYLPCPMSSAQQWREIIKRQSFHTNSQGKCFDHICIRNDVWLALSPHSKKVCRFSLCLCGISPCRPDKVMRLWDSWRVDLWCKWVCTVVCLYVLALRRAANLSRRYFSLWGTGWGASFSSSSPRIEDW